jgi:hypothetical protein
MSDDSQKTDPAPPIEAPLDAFVKGGTTSFAHDMNEKALRHDEAERRAGYDADMHLMSSTPPELGAGKVFTHRLTETPQIPVGSILLRYLNRNGNQVHHPSGEPMICQADLVIVGEFDDGMPERAITLVCPRCIENGVAEDRAQITVRQSNKKFYLDTRTAGTWEIFKGYDAHGKKSPAVSFPSAGLIVDCEKFSCSLCGWTARIDRNRVWPD